MLTLEYKEGYTLSLKSKKPKYGGSSFQTGILFSKKTLDATLYSAVARADDGEITVTTKRVPHNAVASGHSTLFETFKKFSPGGTSASFRAAAMKTLEKNGGKFVGDIVLDERNNPKNRAVAPVVFVFMFFIYTILPIMLTSILPIENVAVVGAVESIIASLLVLLLIFGTFAAFNKKTLLAKYHGAEHKVLKCLNDDEPITIGNVKKQKCYDMKCGTAFTLSLLIFLALFNALVFLYLFQSMENNVLRALVRVVMLPVTYITVFAIFKLTINSKNIIANVIIRIVCAPGLLLQRLLVAKEPSNEQIEVAVVGLKALLEMDENEKCI